MYACVLLLKETMLLRSLLLCMVWSDASSGLEMFYCICHYLTLSIIGFDFEKLVFVHFNYESLHECMFKTNPFSQGLMMIHAQIWGRGADSSAPTPWKIKTFLIHKIKVPKAGSEPLLAPHSHEKLLNQACDSLVNMKVFSGV